MTVTGQARHVVSLLTRMSQRIRRAAPLQAAALAARLPLRKEVVLWESFGGRGLLCHPEALLTEVLAAADLSHLRHIVVLRESATEGAAGDWLGPVIDDPRVTVIRPGTAAYLRWLSTAGTLVNNATFPAWFGTRPGQIYLNTWHGTPLKTMGYDEPDGRVGSANTVRNFLMATHLLAESEDMRERMYRGSYQLGNIFTGQVITTGSPRTDRHVVSADTRRAMVAGLGAAGIELDGRPVILYAPTWHGASFAAAQDNAGQLHEQVTALAEALPGYQILLRVHQQVYQGATRRSDLIGRLVPLHLPANVLLALCDVLVTDYSSICVDVLGGDHDLLFFRPDGERYARERGLDLAPEEHPAPIATEVRGLATLIAALGSGAPEDPRITHAAPRARLAQRWAGHNDGRVSARVVDIVFRGRSGRDVAPLDGDGRPRVMIHTGGLKSNGITTSALALLSHLDLDRWDITAVFDDVDEPDRRANLARIPTGVRCLPRVGAFATGGPLYYLRRAVGGARPGVTEHLARQFKREWRRCYGNACFEHVVDFSGYSPTWSFLLAQAPGATRAIWLHNDLRSDQLRDVAGHRPHERNLALVFASYQFFDSLVSVSRSLRDINAESLAQFAPAERFCWARNSIDAARVRHSAMSAAPAVDPAPHMRTFVTVGRLSPEKNHERLIRAFAQVKEEREDTRLIIIGDGPLTRCLHQLVDDLGMGTSIHLTGVLDNPFPTVAAADCFVLSSDYEGQPMVILEALTLGLPVVTTAFGSVRDALPPGAGLIVDRSVPALAAGMMAALEMDWTHREFDPNRYNDEVVIEFALAAGLKK